MAKTTEIKKMCDSFKYKERDRNVIECINLYFRNNKDAISDGLIEHHITFANTNRNRFYEAYNVSEDDYKKWYSKHKNVIKNDVVNDFLYLLLFNSFLDTKDIIFLDMLSIVEIGSKFKKFFKYGVSNPAKMRYVLENLSDRYEIKKYGSLFLLIQEKNRNIVSKYGKNRIKNGNLDENVNYLISRMSNDINSTLRRISDQYYKTKDDVIYTESENNIDNKISLTNNSVIIDNLKNILENYNPSTLDYTVLKTVRFNSEIRKNLANKIFLELKDRKYFYRISVAYLDYYVENFSNDLADMKQHYIVRCIRGLPKDNDLKVIEKELFDIVHIYAKEYSKSFDEKPDLDGLYGTNNKIAYVKSIKNYCIIKTRQFMNEL